MVAVTEDQYRTATREQGLTDFRYGLESYGNEATIKNGGPIGAHTYTHLVSLSELIYFINLREQDYRFVIMIDRRFFDRWETVETNKSHRDRLQKGREWGEREREIERDKEKKREREGKIIKPTISQSCQLLVPQATNMQDNWNLKSIRLLPIRVICLRINGCDGGVFFFFLRTQVTSIGANVGNWTLVAKPAIAMVG